MAPYVVIVRDVLIYMCVWFWELYIGKYVCYPDYYALCKAQGYKIIKLGFNGCAFISICQYAFWDACLQKCACDPVAP